MNRFTFDARELAALCGLQREVVAQYSCSEDPGLHRRLAVLAQALPPRLCAAVSDFQQSRPPRGLFLLEGPPIDQDQIGPTPAHWKDRSDRARTFAEQAFLLLCASLLGDVFSWSTLQGGRLVTDIFPVEEFADSQLGTSSRQPLYWHTEDAFHPCRADYVVLLCLRNPDGIETRVCSIDQVLLRSPHVEVLFQERFLIFPDSSHLELNQVDATTPGRRDEQRSVGLQRRHAMRARPEPVAVLFGDRCSPCLRIDPLMMQCLPGDQEAQEALGWLTRELEEHMFPVVLEPGDLLIIDNFRVVHGRGAFAARFNGTDRWLKRALVTRDLQASRHLRAASESRIIA